MTDSFRLIFTENNLVVFVKDVRICEFCYPVVNGKQFGYLAADADTVRSRGTCSLASITQPMWLSTGGLLLCLVFLFLGVYNNKVNQF